MSLQDDLEEVAHWNGPRQRAWLLERAAVELADKNWWLGIIEFCTGRATTLGAVDPGERSRMLSLGLEAIEVATETAMLDQKEAVLRRANLSLAMERHGDPGSFDSRLDLDSIAHGVIDVLDRKPADVEALASDWRGLPVEQIRDLRQIKYLVKPFRDSQRTIRDDSTRTRMEEWKRLLPALP